MIHPTMGEKDEDLNEQGERLRRRIAIFAGMVQSILMLAHFFVYETWVTLWERRRGRGERF